MPILFPSRGNGALPFYSKPCYPWLLSQHMPPHLLDDWLGGRIIVHFLGVVFVVDIIADADELAVIVAAGEEDDGDAKDFRGRDAFEIG